MKGHAMYDFESHIVDIPDYPEPGVVFKDITPLFSNPEALKAMVDALTEHFSGMGITKVVGPEARGFMHVNRENCHVRPLARNTSSNMEPIRLRFTSMPSALKIPC